MPQVGWLCVFSDEKKTFSDCIECSQGPQHCEFTPEMLISMKRNLTSFSNPEEPSITRVLKECLRAAIIEIEFDYWVSPRKNYFAFRGSLVHSLLEGVRTKDSWTEISQSRPIDIGGGEHITLWGRVDRLVPSRKLIRDYKTCAQVPKKDEVYGRHKEQLNGYRWLWWPVIEIEKLRLQYVDMRRTKQMKVPIMALDEIEAILAENTRIYVYAFRTGTIPPGTCNLSNYPCSYCDVTDICMEITSLEEQHGRLSAKEAAELWKG